MLRKKLLQCELIWLGEFTFRNWISVYCVKMAQDVESTCHLLRGNGKKSPPWKTSPNQTNPIQIKVCFEMWDRNSPFQIPELLLGCTFHKAARTQDLYITYLHEFAFLGLHLTAVSQTRKLPVCAIQMHLQTDGKIKNNTNEKHFGGQ